MQKKVDVGVAGGKRSILIVEDNEMNREMLCAVLEENYRILQAENGLVGLDLLEQNYQDLSLVLLDVFMPECDGFEFLRRKKQNADLDTVPVIVMTASNSTEDEIRCLELGANDFVTKPYNFDIILNRANNIIQLRESASMLNHLMWDNGTGLYSKEFFYRYAAEEMAQNPDTDYDMICSDVERFKTMNDRYGQKKCDEFLRHLADRLSEVLPEAVYGGRIGGDIFGFLLKHGDRDLPAILSTVMDSEEYSSFVIKYGVVENVDRSLPVSAVCDRATLALEGIKGNYNAQVACFDDKMRDKLLKEQQLVEFMERALEEHQFQVYFQPKHDLKRDRTGGAEALVRWIHPDLGFISPGLFIPIFEQNGFITKLDFYIWEEVCREIVRCREQGIPVVPISTNMSRLDFDTPDLARRILEMADSYGISHELLHFELTESAYSDNVQSIENVLGKLHSFGFGIELDDFGSGYSSLASLNSLSLDVMKLDMSIIRQATARNDFRVIQASIQLAETLKLKTVAEGVETLDVVEKMKELGCDYIQGYYYAKPMPGGDFREYLKKEAALSEEESR